MGNRRRELVDREAGVYRYDQLIVLKSTQMPAVLMEAGSIVNRSEELLLATPEHEAIMAGAVAEAVDAFCTALAKPSQGPVVAKKPDGPGAKTGPAATKKPDRPRGAKKPYAAKRKPGTGWFVSGSSSKDAPCERGTGASTFRHFSDLGCYRRPHEGCGATENISQTTA